MPVITAVALFGCSDPTPTAPLGAEPLFNASAGPTPPAALGWQEQAGTLVAANNMSPLAASRVYALLSVAQYGAIDNVDHTGSDGTIPSNGFGAGGRARFEAERGAVAGASWQVLAFLFPAAAAGLEQRVRDEAASRGVTHPEFQRGIDAGIEMATAMIARARSDHFTDPWTGTVPVGPGLWLNNGPPAGPLFGTVTPYFLSSGSQFRPAPPPAFGSAAFLTDLNEISTLSTARTPQQLATAQFWSFPTGTFTPLGHWNQLASTYFTRYGLNERAAAHVFALVHAAAFDGLGRLLGGEILLLVHPALAGQSGHHLADRPAEPSVLSVGTLLQLLGGDNDPGPLLPGGGRRSRQSAGAGGSVAHVRRHSLPLRYHRPRCSSARRSRTWRSVSTRVPACSRGFAEAGVRPTSGRTRR